MSEATNLGHRIAKGATWLVFQRMAIRIIGLVSTVVLARILVPEDFGLVALATGLLAVIDLLLELGFDMALIQNQSDGRKRYNTAWTLSILRGLFVGLVLLAAAQPMATLYDDQRLVWVVIWLALVAIISGFQNICIVEFRKELRFDREFSFLVWSKVAAFIVTMTMVWIWRDYRALIAGIVAGKVAAVILSYLMHPYRPALSLVGARGFINFSKWLALSNVIMIVKTRLDTFVVGKVSGTEALGVYSIAFEISNLTSTELVSPISRVLFSGFSKMSDDRPRLARSFIDSLAIIAFLAAPIAVGIAITAEYIVTIFLGVRWLPTVPLIQILTLYGLLNLTSANVGALYLALGRSDLYFWRNVPSVVVLVPGLIIGTLNYGVIGAAWALVLSALIGFIVNFYMIRRELGVGVTAILIAIWRPIVAATIMLVAVTLLQRNWPMADDIPHLLFQVVVLAFCGACVYAGTVTALWALVGSPAGAEQRFWLLLKAFFHKRATT